jgi:hypothetical protein
MAMSASEHQYVRIAHEFLHAFLRLKGNCIARSQPLVHHQNFGRNTGRDAKKPTESSFRLNRYELAHRDNRQARKRSHRPLGGAFLYDIHIHPTDDIS